MNLTNLSELHNQLNGTALHKVCSDTELYCFLNGSNKFGFNINASFLEDKSELLEPCEDFWCLLQTISISIITLLIILTNLLDIAVICFSFAALDTCEYFMLSLSFADLGVGILVTPFSILPSYYQSWVYSPEWCSITATVVAVLCTVSIYSIMFISVNRYLNIIYPLHSQQLLTKPRSIFAIALIWTVSLAVFITNNIMVNEYYFDHDSYICSIDFPNQPKFTVTITATVVAPPAIIIAFVYMRIFCTAKRHRTKISDLSQFCSHQASATKTRVSLTNVSAWKSAKMYVFIIGGFCLAWIPFSFLQLVLCTTDLPVPKALDFLILWTAMANSFWNTIIYFLMHKKYRDGCNKMLKCVLSRNRVSDIDQ